MESDGEITDELYNELIDIEDTRDNKLEALCRIISMSKAEIKTIGDEIERLQSIKNKNESIIERLKVTITDTLKLHNLRGKSGNYSHKVGTYSIWTTNRKSIDIDELKLLSYNPINGNKSNDFIKYSLNKTLSNLDIRKIEESVDINEDDIIFKVDKREVLKYMQETGQTGFEEEPKEGSIEELLMKEDALPSSIKPEDKIDFAKIVEKDSLTIR
jgi:hypothetical protein